MNSKLTKMPACICRLACSVLGHRYRFVCITLERDRYFRCRRCGKEFCTG